MTSTDGRTSTAQTSTLLSTVLTELASVVDGVRDDQLGAATPCDDFDVAALREHIVGWLVTFAAGYADPEGRAPRASLDGFTAPGDPAEQVRAAAASVRQSIADGAAQRPMYLGEASMPGDMVLRMMLWEYLVHGWDLASATGQAWEPPVAAAESSLEFAPGMLSPEYQGEGKAFGPRVPVAEDAPALTRLVALSGRDPGSWPR